MTELTEDKLTVTVAYCPAVRPLRSTGRTVSRWYSYTTETVMRVLTEAAGYRFEMQSYNEETGVAVYQFFA